MKKNHLSTETLVFEIISAIAALFYMGLQVYYGIVYGAGAVRIVMNVLILILVVAVVFEVKIIKILRKLK